jgi:Rrf2 family iron-sulfur cluster assembly transcriptional regulator
MVFNPFDRRVLGGRLASFQTELVWFKGMQITKAAEYGVLGLIALSRRPLGEVVMIDVLCEEESVPKSFLGKIFQNLCKSGLIGSSRGSGGGFYLARPAAEISVLEVIESIEGPIALQRCLEVDEGCEHSRGCALCGLLAEAQERMKSVFSGTSLATLAGRHLPNGLIQQARQHPGGRIPLVVSNDPSGSEPGASTSEPVSGTRTRGLPLLDPLN